MTLAGPRDSTIAVVGDGFGSALVYTTAVYLGFRSEQVTVLGQAAERTEAALETARGAYQAALLFQRLTRDPGGTPVEYVRSLYRGDRYEVHSRLERGG